MALPTYSSSLISAVSKVQQNTPFPKYVLGGRNASTYKLFKQSTAYVFQVWRSQVFSIGKNFDVLEVKFAVNPDMAANMSIIPVLYFDNQDSNSVGTTIDSTNYANSERLIKLTSHNFANGVHGRHNFFLELQLSGSALAVVELPITFTLEVEDV